MDKKWIISIIVTIIIGLILGISIAFFTERNRNETEGTEFVDEKELAGRLNGQTTNNLSDEMNVIEDELDY